MILIFFYFTAYLIFPNYLFCFLNSNKLTRYLLAFPPLIISAILFPDFIKNNVEKDFLNFILSTFIYSFFKSLEYSEAKYDPSVTKSRIKFMIYFLVGTDVKFDETFTQVRWNGLKRIMFGILDIAISVFLIVFCKKVQLSLWYNPLIWNFYFFIFVYFNIKGTLNGLFCGLILLIYGDGIHIANMWNNLIFSKSLKEFWAGWNVGVRNIFYRCIYKPLGGNSLSIILIYTLSGILHEYPSWVAYGTLRGNMFLFFFLNGIYIIMESSIPQKIRIYCFWTFILLTSSIFSRDFGKSYFEILTLK